MSAVNAIINRAPALLLAAALVLYPVMAVAVGEPAKAPATKDSLSAQLNKMTEKQGPRSAAPPEQASTGGITELNVVSIITADEQGAGLRLPYSVFCDRVNNETYVLDKGQITVYGPDFFPVATIGAGRGALSASGVYVDDTGNVYVPQSTYYDKPARITVYNAAFFPVRQIELGDIPGVEGSPTSLVIGDNGFMYVAFDGVRGLLVLDAEGAFSHWLKPMDLIFDQAAIVQTQEAREQEEEGAAAGEEPDFDVSELVPELVPKGGDKVFAAEEEPGMGPVQVNYIQRDKDGNLYLLSTETSKVYIYNHDEEFLYNFGEKGGSTGKLSQPSQLVVDDRKKAIYIVDYMRHAILIYDLSGRFMHEFGGMGNQPGWFQYPKAIATTAAGELLVADMFNRRVQVLDVQFEYKFPLFQVPFVYQERGLPQPQPMAKRERFYGPGFSPGEQASTVRDREDIRKLLAPDDDLI